MAKLIDANYLMNLVSEHTDMHGWGHGSLAIEQQIKDLIKIVPEVPALVLGKEYSSGDYVIETENHKGYQTFCIKKRRST